MGENGRSPSRGGGSVTLERYDKEKGEREIGGGRPGTEKAHAVQGPREDGRKTLGDEACIYCIMYNCFLFK